MGPLEPGPDRVALIPRGDKLYYSTEALRAYIWHKQGRLHDAVVLLVNVVQAKNDSRYLEAWALNWLRFASRTIARPSMDQCSCVQTS